MTLSENIIHVTDSDFEEKVLNADGPVLIDYWAEWCGPCKMVSPIMEELSDEYAGKVDIYKVDTEVEQELSSVFGIRSIPSILFIPTEGQPMMQPGALPKPAFKEVIEKELLQPA